MALDFKAIEQIFEAAAAEGRYTLLEHEVYGILAAAGLNVPAHRHYREIKEITTDSLEEIPGEDVVVKVVSPDIQHKTEFGGIRVVRRTEAAVREVMESYCQRAAAKKMKPVGALVCEKINLFQGPGREYLLSLRVDRAFGPVIAFGMGGVLTEYWGENLKEGRSLTVRTTADISGDGPRVARGVVNETVAGDFLAGRVRGQAGPLVPPGTTENALLIMKDLSEAFSPLCPDSKWTLEELEVNPLAVDSWGRLVVLDGLGHFSDHHYKIQPRPVKALKSLLEPKSILVIGASGKGINPGRIILNNLLASDRYSAENIYLLHNTEEKIAGVKCYATADALPEGIDMAVVTIPASEKAVQLIDELAQKNKVRTFTLISSGFGETEGGKDLQKGLEQTITTTRNRADGGILMNGPNCLGIVSEPGDYNTFFLPAHKLPIHKGRIGGSNLASVSQSGAFLVCQISHLGHYMTPRYSISFGNQVDVSVSDYVHYFARDDAVQVISIYIEGFQPYDGLALLKAAQVARAAGKSVIVYKTGRTKAGAAAASSHTAAIAGDYAVARHCFAEVGIKVTPDLETFNEWIVAFSLLGNKDVTGRQVAVITNAGFETTVGSDRLGTLSLAEFTKKTWTRMTKALPDGIIDFRNPVDATPICPTEAYLECIRAMEADVHVDNLLISCVPATPVVNVLPPGDGHKEDLYAKDSFGMGLVEIFRKTRKPMVVCIDAGMIYDPLVELLLDNGVPTYRKIDRAMVALDAFVDDRLAD
jgi:acyl-CoA synthetase (NDP forming)